MLNIQRIQYCFINIWNIIIISFGLSLDAFAVSVANGNIVKSKKLFHALKFAISFSFFQMFMPLIGWLMGVRFQKIMGNIDHWIAFTILLLIGIKMIYEALKIEKVENKFKKSSNLLVLLGLSIAV